MDTENDIKRHKQLAYCAYQNLKQIFKNNKLSDGLKLRFFYAIIATIFLYNCQIWTTTKQVENKVDIIHRNLLRGVLNIRWYDKISNDELYQRTNVQKWSTIVKVRRLSFFGHVCRLPEGAPARRTLIEALRPCERPRGRPKTVWIDNIRDQLKEVNINTIKEGIFIAQDRDKYRVTTRQTRM